MDEFVRLTVLAAVQNTDTKSVVACGYHTYVIDVCNPTPYELVTCSVLVLLLKPSFRLSGFLARQSSNGCGVDVFEAKVTQTLIKMGRSELG